MNLKPKQLAKVNEINHRGILNNPPYRFKAFVEGDPTRAWIELLDGTDPKNRLISEILRSPQKNFYHHYPTLAETESQVNFIGDRSNPRFKFHSILPKLSKNRKRVIRVYCPETGEYANREQNELVNKRRNPFREEKDLYELKVVHPQLLKKLKEWKITILHHEEFIAKGVKPDFVIRADNGMVYFLEAKTIRSKRAIHKYELVDQVKKYNKAGKKIYGKDFGGTILVSPDGSNHCISFDELFKKLKTNTKSN